MVVVAIIGCLALILAPVVQKVATGGKRGESHGVIVYQR